jgi:hypothetical protein
MEAQSSSATPPRRKSSKARRDLQATIAQIDALFPALADKPSKQADILCEKASAIKTLLSLDAEERENEQDQRIKELEAEHEGDARRIAELEQQNAMLRASLIPETVKIPDPEHAAVRQENTRLSTLLKVVAESIPTEHQRAQVAIRVIEKCSQEAARFCVPLLGFSYQQYAQMLMTHKTQQQLNHVISAAQCEGPAVIFAKAALALRDRESGKAREAVARQDSDERQYVPDTRSAEEKLREAKELTRKAWALPARSSRIQLAEPEQENYREAVDRKIFSDNVTSFRQTQSDDPFH